MDILVSSKLSTVQTVALVEDKDIIEFGLKRCLKEILSELDILIKEGFYDEKLKTTIQVRVICSLGDNLESNPICGLTKKFSTVEHSCRKCFCSRTDLKRANTYSDIHSVNHEERTDASLQRDFLESQEKKVKHINGVCKESLFKDLPFFNFKNAAPVLQPWHVSSKPFLIHIIFCKSVTANKLVYN